MTEIRRADPAARRQVLLLLAVTAAAGVVLYVGAERYAPAIRDWTLADPSAAAGRVRLVFLLFGGILVAPLLAFAAYLWRLGARGMQAAEFPPPGYRVVSDTLVLRGADAVARGRGARLVALVVASAGVALLILCWRLGAALALPR